MATVNIEAIVLLLVFIDFSFTPTAAAGLRFPAAPLKCNFDTRPNATSLKGVSRR